MASTTHIESPVARKKHLCSICGTFIYPGTRYDRWRYFDCGDASTVKVHPDCWLFFQDHSICEWTDDTLWEQLTGWMHIPEALEAIRGFTDTRLRDKVLLAYCRWLADDFDVLEVL